MARPVPRIIDDLRRGRVQSIADNGDVVMLFPDGHTRVLHIPHDTVELVRRLTEVEKREPRPVVGGGAGGGRRP